MVKALIASWHEMLKPYMAGEIGLLSLEAPKAMENWGSAHPPEQASLGKDPSEQLPRRGSPYEFLNTVKMAFEGR